MKDTLIAVPTVGGIDGDVVGFLLEAQKRGYEVRIFKDYSPIPFARNVIASSFLKTKYDRLWMVDSDTIPRANIWGLPDVNADIVSPLYSRKRLVIRDGEPRISYNVRRFDDLDDVDTVDDFFPEIGQGAIPVDAVGTGCILIKRHVLEDEQMLLDPKWVHMDGSERTDEGDEVKPFFRNTYSAVGRYKGGNDYDFCLRARRLGYEVAVQTNILCGHRKEIDLAALVRLTEFCRGRLPLDALAGLADYRNGERI